MNVHFRLHIRKSNSHEEINCATCGKVPKFLIFLCNRSKSNLISFNDFKNTAMYYNTHVKKDDTSPSVLRKTFIMLMILFGQNGKLLKNKILNYGFASHIAKVKELNIIKYGPPLPRPPGSGSHCGNCSCPSDNSQSGCGCGCSWGVCYGWCSGNSCDYSSIPWFC